MNLDNLEAELRPKLTDEFLETLVQAIRICGWEIDYEEGFSFVEWCFGLVGREMPEDMEPYGTAS